MNKILRHPVEFWVAMAGAMLIPSVASANVGTPLMWAGFFHLCFGNLLIGVGEGWLLAILFQQPAVRRIGIMILANYFSAWVGMIFLAWMQRHIHVDLYSIRPWLWMMVFVTWLMTLVLEWPFVAFCLRKTQGWFRKSAWGTLVVQSASYLVIFGWYWSASGMTLHQGFAVVPPSEIHVSAGCLLYYISSSDGNVCVMDVQGKESKKVHELGAFDDQDRLFVKRSSSRPDQWDLVAILFTSDKEPMQRTLLADLTSQTVSSPRDDLDENRPTNTWGNFGEVPQLGAAVNSPWKFRAGFWQAEGLRGENAGDHRQLRLAVETPFVSWGVRNATQLPNDQVVFQLGRNQICILDPNEKKVALLARGRGPVVAIKEGTE